MPENAHEMHGRAVELGLRRPPLEEWDTFPFEGEIRPRALAPYAEEEPPRLGEDPADCWRCAHTDEDALWSDARWRVMPMPEPSGLPVIVILEPKEHHDLPDLPPELAADLGPTIVRVERAVRAVPSVARVHVGRWGEGSAHLHVWFMARPFGFLQLRSSFAAIWADVLPPVPEDVWRENLAIVAAALRE